MALSKEQRDTLLERFRSGPNQIRHFLRDVPDEARHFRTAPGTWTIHEILVHLGDSEAHAYIRFRRALAEPGSSVIAYDQDKWTSGLHYERLDADLHVELFTSQRRATDALLTSLAPDDWNRTIMHPEHGAMTIDDILVMYADHAELHVGQMQRTLAAWRAAQHA
jgi:uncharacterized damage-inducible protein DinB